MFTPYHHPVFADQRLPEPSFWPEMRRICDENGIVLIMDDVRAGWRLDHQRLGPLFRHQARPGLLQQGHGQWVCHLHARGDLRKLGITASKAYMTGSFWMQWPRDGGRPGVPRRDGERINVTKVVKELGEALMKGLNDLRRGPRPEGFHHRAPCHSLS
ncbi:MAG: hypothetical protein MZV70_57040 [Desulfobacterales bacterium]|nr:hypothetical protein [Desulfobacterales bacterium]